MSKNGKQIWCHATKNGVKVLYESGRKIYLPADQLKQPQKPKVFNNQLINPEKDKLNSYHQKLYNTAMHGLQVIAEKTIKQFSPSQKKEVVKFYQKAQRAINRLKNEVLEQDLKKLCKKTYLEEFRRFEKEEHYEPCQLFPFTFLYELCNLGCQELHEEVPNSLPLSFLGITKKQVVERLIRENLSLPHYLQSDPVEQLVHP